MKTKPIPILLALVASFIACVLSIVQGVEFSVFFRRFCATALIFLFLGFILKMVIDHGFKTEEDEDADTEGEEDGEGEADSESSDDENADQSDEDDDEYDEL